MRFLLRLAAVAACGFLATSAVAKTFNLEHEHVPGQLIVKFKESVQAANQVQVFDRIGAKSLHTFKSNGAQLIQFAAEGETDLLAQAKYLAALPGVDYVEANTILRIDVTNEPNDPRFGELYGLHNTGATGGTEDADIDALEAWSVSTGSRDVVVGVIDTGVDYNHPDIAPNYWTNPGETGVDADGNDKSTNGIDDDGNGFVDDFRGWDFANDDNDPMDDNDHGTHCAGTIGGAGNDGVGVVGVVWEVSIVGIKFLTGGGSGTLADAVESIEYANTLNLDLTSNSWGGGGFSDTMAAAIQAAEDQDILFIAAAGNSNVDNDRSPHYPSSYEHDTVIAVAATDHNDDRASFSCYGLESVDLGAPGKDILSSTPNNTYKSFSGTSMATPHVAGAAALVMAVYPDATGAEVKARLMNTADPISALEGKTVTGGRLNVNNSLENDSVPPGAALALEMIGAGTTRVDLQWAAAGDDGDNGLAARYEVRYASAPIETMADWEAATRAVVETAFDRAARLVTGSVGGLSFNSEGYVAVRPFDNVGNAGPVSDSIAYAVLPVTTIIDNPADSMDGIVADAPWGLEADVAREGTVFSDSPDGQYANDLNVAMTLPSFAVSTADIALAIRTKYDIENGYDNAHVELSTDDGATWQEVDKMTGSADWSMKVYDLSSYLAGADSVSIRFRLQTDYSVTKDGWLIDDVTILAPAK